MGPFSRHSEGTDPLILGSQPPECETIKATQSVVLRHGSLIRPVQVWQVWFLERHRSLAADSHLLAGSSHAFLCA